MFRNTSTYMRQAIALSTFFSLMAMVMAAHAQGLSDVKAGNVAFRDGQFENAIDAYSRAILSGELDVEAMAITFNNRGVVYGELGDFDRAIADYQEALVLKPDDSTTFKNLRVAYSRRGDARTNLGETEKAIADYTQALQIDPEHAPTLRKRALSLEAIGNLDSALTDLERATELDPQDDELQVALARVTEAKTARDNTNNEAIPSIAEADTSNSTDSQNIDNSTNDNEINPATRAEDTASPEPDVRENELAENEAETGGEGNTQPLENQSIQEQVETAAAATIETAKRSEAPTYSEDEIANAKLFQAISPVNFRNGPGNDFDKVGAISQGDQVKVLGIDKGWMQVIVPNGEEGYIYQKWLEPVAAE